MNNKELLHPFDLAQAEAGAAVRWSELDEPITFVGRSVNGGIAIRRADGVIETPCRTSLRMKPLFWKEGKPVYAGDNLWHTLSRKWITVDRLQNNLDAEQNGHFYSADGSRNNAALCRFEEPPEPLFILKNKPVHKGDRLWHTHYKKWVTVASGSLLPFGDFLDENGTSRSPYFCSWDKPKTTVVRYANVYNLFGSSPCIGEMHSTVDGLKNAFGSKNSIGIARIEWQE